MPSLHLSSQNGLSQNTVWRLSQDTLGRIWMGSPGGLQAYDGNRVINFPISDGIVEMFVHGNAIYTLTRDAIHKIDAYSFALNTFELPTRNMKWSHKAGFGIQLTHEKEQITLWIDEDLQPQAGPGTAYVVAREDSSLRCANTQIRWNTKGAWIADVQDSIVTQSLIHDVYSLSANRCLISSGQGLWEVAYENGEWSKFNHFPNQGVEAILADRLGNIWVATAGDGVYLLHRNALNMHFYAAKNAQGGRVACWTFFGSDTDLYCATSEGIMALGKDSLRLASRTRGMATISGCITPSICLVGTARNGLYRIDKSQITQVFFNSENVLDNTIVEVKEVPEGFIAASKRGVILLDKAGQLTRYVTFAELGLTPYFMHLNWEDDHFLASMVNGLVTLKPDLSEITVLQEGIMDVVSMAKNINDTLWAVSMNDGLLRWNGDSLEPVPFPSEQLFTLVEGNDGMWISGAHGLYRRTAKGVFSLGEGSGIPLDEFNQNGVHKAANGTLSFAGVGGFVRFHPDSLDLAVHWPGMALSRNGILLSDKGITLDYDQGEIALECTPVWPTDKTQFEVTVRSGERDFSITQSGEFLMPVAYGSSMLEVVILHVPSGEFKRLETPLERATPFWWRWWFWVSVVLMGAVLILGTVALLGFLRTRRLLALEKADRKVTDERLRISRELHDNIGARLTHIISSLDVEMYQRKEAESLANVNAFARQTMAQLRETIWAVSEKTVFFSEFTTRIEQYLSESKKLTGRTLFLANSVKGDFELNPVQTINFFRIIQEAINNAIKYSDAEQIVVRIDRQDFSICLEIVDNGEGFDLATVRTGSGLQGMEARAKEAGAVWEIKSSPAIGTAIRLTFTAE